jgi:4-oxalocrotonate tautomerase
MKTKPFGTRNQLLRCLPINQSNQKESTKEPMPLINVKMLEGVFTPRQKQDMSRKLTDTMVAIEGENMRPVTVVVLEEVRSGDWGIGGQSYTTGDVKALAADTVKG